MTAKEAVNWITNIMADIGKSEHSDLWHYEQALTEIREMLEFDAQQWIPCKTRLPEELEEVNVTWINHYPESYYDFVKGKPFTGSAVYYKEKWYWYSSTCTDILGEYGENDIDEVDDAIEIVAWKPFDEPWKGDQS